ncbi:hypothetical protein SKAU_G00104700 [Synaphobranchus kaupii]|uniref:Uncharacterized protein n=1 Tax=Synaphobranchus kaupii TaxID=118154 RepID=A0A9Q1J6Q6_SYNKA|nr:hypothetical protein SKAU_G00104700 [Synaphobranchus kaupii]
MRHIVPRRLLLRRPRLKAFSQPRHRRACRNLTRQNHRGESADDVTGGAKTERLKNSSARHDRRADGEALNMLVPRSSCQAETPSGDPRPAACGRTAAAGCNVRGRPGDCKP